MAKEKAKSVRIPSARSEDQPTTRKMLSFVRDELSQKMEAGFSKVGAEFSKVEAEFSKVEARFSSLRSEIQGLRSEIQGQRSDFQRLESGYSRMQLLLEEQNANNRIVLEGLQALWQRQERVEKRLG